MKTLLTVIAAFLFAQTTSADTLLKLKDGTAYVWSGVEVRGSQYCKADSLIDFCVKKSEVASKKEVESGTVDPKDVGTADTAGLGSQSDNLWAAQYDEKAENDRKERNAADDRKQASEHNRRVRDYGEEKATQMERAGNSVTGGSSSSSNLSTLRSSRGKQYTVR